MSLVKKVKVGTDKGKETVSWNFKKSFSEEGGHGELAECEFTLCVPEQVSLHLKASVSSLQNVHNIIYTLQSHCKDVRNSRTRKSISLLLKSWSLSPGFELDVMFTFC